MALETRAGAGDSDTMEYTLHNDISYVSHARSWDNASGRDAIADTGNGATLRVHSRVQGNEETTTVGHGDMITVNITY